MNSSSSLDPMMDPAAVVTEYHSTDKADLELDREYFLGLGVTVSSIAFDSVANDWAFETFVSPAPAPAAGAEYNPEVRFHAAQNGRAAYWHAGVRKVGNVRVTSWCRHRHEAEAAAVECGNVLAALRNA